MARSSEIEFPAVRKPNGEEYSGNKTQTEEYPDNYHSKGNDPVLHNLRQSQDRPATQGRGLSPIAQTLETRRTQLVSTRGRPPKPNPAIALYMTDFTQLHLHDPLLPGFLGHRFGGMMPRQGGVHERVSRPVYGGP